MIKRALMLIGMLMLSLEGKTQNLNVADAFGQLEDQDAKDLLILHTQGADRQLLKKIISTRDFSTLSTEEQVRANKLLNLINRDLNNDSRPWATI